MAEATGNLKDTVRNLGQTHQERPIIKMAPDAIVYIDGLPYLFNDFVGKSGTVFNFNDFVTQASGAADINTWVPSCTVNLSIPNDLKFLAMAPAGQRIIKTMSEIKIFTKGYYLTEAGDTVYHRIFWGVIAGVSYSDNRKTLEISLTCRGILHLFDLMQLNLAPSVATAQAQGGEVTPFKAQWEHLNPLETILHTFKYPLGQDIYDPATVAENNTWVPDDLFERSYVIKWNRHLVNMRNAVRLHGLASKKKDKPGSPRVSETPTTTAPDPKSQDPGAGQGRQGTVIHTKDEVERAGLIDFELIAKFLPAYQIGSVQLLQSTLTSRLTRVDEMVRMIGYEGYQDVDGSIVIKPPLYNLDTQNTTAPPTRNPFIIHLPEVLNVETETEDESQVRMTRTTVKGEIDRLLGDAGASVIPEATYFDPVLVHQFGVRTEPPKSLPVLGSFGYVLFGFAVSEQVKLNKNYRTYTVTIPMRPEIRLGFPIYVPHNDFYAYLENVSWNYVRGGQATMTLSCTQIRHREMFAKEKVTELPITVSGVLTKVQIKEWVYTSVPNLVVSYTAQPAAGQSINSKNQVTTNPVGAEMTQPSKDPKLQDPTSQQKELIARENRLKLLTGTKEDSKGISWRVSDGEGGFFANVATGGVVNKAYYDTITHVAMPYTDEKGYNVVRPFPWGRYMKLEDALDMLTRPEERRTKKLLPHEAASADKAPDAGKAPAKGADTQEISGKLVPVVGATVEVVATDTDPDAFIMTGLGTPSLTTTDPTKGTEADKKLMDKLYNLKELIGDDTTFFVVSFEAGNEDSAKSDPYSSGEKAGNDTAVKDAPPPKDPGTPAAAADAGKDKAEAEVYNISTDSIGPSEFSQ